MGVFKNLFWNSEEARLRAGWRILVAFIVWLTLLFAVLGLRDAVLAKRLAELYTETVTTAIHALLVLVVFLWLVGSRLLDRRPLADYGFHMNWEWWLDLGFGLVLATLLLAGIFVVELAMGWIKITDTFVTADSDQSFALGIVISLIGIPLGAIQEEMTWRGYILRNLAEGFNWKIIGPRWA